MEIISFKTFLKSIKCLIVDVDDSDASISFTEHVFLDKYLAEFPQLEPVQKFMRIILTGLSQNSYLSVKEKRETIEWYKRYFAEKLDIITEALEAEKYEAEYEQNVAAEASKLHNN